MKGKSDSPSNNRIEESGRGLRDDSEWVLPVNSEREKENLQSMGNVDALNLNNQLFRGDTNSIEGSEITTKRSTFDPNDPFSIYAFREPEEMTTTTRTTPRATREYPRGFTSRLPSNRWVWDSQPQYPVSFPSSPSFRLILFDS